MQDDSPPTYISGVTPDSGSSPALCVWPPNSKYWCVLDIFSQSGGTFIRTNILPVSDNCAAVNGFNMLINSARAIGANAPSGTGLSGTGFGCTDTDPRSQLGALQLLQCKVSRQVQWPFELHTAHT